MNQILLFLYFSLYTGSKQTNFNNRDLTEVVVGPTLDDKLL